MMHQALIMDSEGSMQLKMISTPKTQSHDVLVRPLWAGICGTDVQIMRRMRTEHGPILGHEGVGEVIERGDCVSHVALNEVVTFLPTDPTGSPDILGHTVPGLFQHRLHVPASPLGKQLLMTYPLAIPLQDGPLLEPLATAIYAFETCTSHAVPKSVAIIGAGSLGLLLAIVARLHGVEQIFLLHHQRSRLDWACRRSIVTPQEAVLMQENLGAEMDERTHGEGVEVIFLCTPRNAALQALSTALRLCASDGCIDMIGGITKGDTINQLSGIDLGHIRAKNHCGYPTPAYTWYGTTSLGKAIKLTGHRGIHQRHMLAAMDLMQRMPAVFRAIISHVVSLAGAATLFEAWRHTTTRRYQQQECVKVLVDCTRVDQYIQVIS